MPPSVHPDTGALYEWRDDPDDLPLARLPEPWLERARAVEPRGVRAQREGSVDRVDDPLLEIDAETYFNVLTGRSPDGRGYVQCPFHKGGHERRPDLKLYGATWACFACHGPGPNGKLGGTIYTFAGRLWGYALPLRGPAFLRVQDRLLDVFTTHFAGAAR